MQEELEAWEGASSEALELVERLAQEMKRLKEVRYGRVRIPPAPGHGQTGERPAIMLGQDDRFIATLPTVLIVPFTSTLAAARFDGTLLLQPDNQNGLAVSSVALVFQVPGPGQT